MNFYSEKTQVKHILNVFNKASQSELIDGASWYKEAQIFSEHLNELFKVESPVKIAGIISALSPAVNWERNKVDAQNLLALYTSTGGNEEEILKGKFGTYKNNVRKAIEILNLKHATKKKVGVILRGKTGYKTESFFYNIYDVNSEEVTIDRHAVKVANNVYKGGSVALSEKKYRLSERAYIKASKKVGLKPYQLQAVVWVTYRRLRGL